MKTIGMTSFRKRLNDHLDFVDRGEPLLVTWRNRESFVVVRKDALDKRKLSISDHSVDATPASSDQR